MALSKDHLPEIKHFNTVGLVGVERGRSSHELLNDGTKYDPSMRLIDICPIRQ